MGVILTPTLNYTWDGEVPQQVFLQPTVNTPEIKNLFTIQERVKSKWQIHNAGALDKVTKAASGCGNSSTGSGLAITNKTLEVVDLAIYLDQCADVFKDSVWETALKNGVAENDLSQTQIQEQIIKPLILDVARRDMHRILFFGDTTDIDPDFNQLDGVWTKLIAAVGSGVTLSSVPFSAGAMAAGEAIAVLSAMYNEAPVVLKQLGINEKKFLVTGSVYENYMQSLENKDNTEAGWKAIQDGVLKLFFRGIEVVPDYAQDGIIAAEAFANPNRAIYTTRDNHVVGFDVSKDSLTLKTWFSDDDDIMKYKIKYKMGYEFKQEELTVIGL